MVLIIGKSDYLWCSSTMFSVNCCIYDAVNWTQQWSIPLTCNALSNCRLFPVNTTDPRRNDWSRSASELIELSQQLFDFNDLAASHDKIRVNFDRIKPAEMSNWNKRSTHGWKDCCFGVHLTSRSILAIIIHILEVPKKLRSFMDNRNCTATAALIITITATESLKENEEREKEREREGGGEGKWWMSTIVQKKNKTESDGFFLFLFPAGPCETLYNSSNINILMLRLSIQKSQYWRRCMLQCIQRSYRCAIISWKAAVLELTFSLFLVKAKWVKWNGGGNVQEISFFKWNRIFSRLVLRTLIDKRG